MDPGVDVNASINQEAKKLREALSGRKRFIETGRGEGYRFIMDDVKRNPIPNAIPSDKASSCRRFATK
jgi:DNA-binding winged helix-turn-helix (wHTH) protein